MSETHHTTFAGGGNVKMGTATLVASTGDPDVGTVAVATGFSLVLSAQATYAEHPGSAAVLYRTISGGTVTFYAGNSNGIDIDYLIVGLT